GVFLTLDDATGPIDLTFFEDVQGPYAATVFHSWLLLCRGVVRRTGPKGLSIRATGAWELSALQEAWSRGGPTALHAALAEAERSAQDRAAVLADADAHRTGRRVLVHASGYRQSPYADVRPAGAGVRGARPVGDLVPAGSQGAAPRKLWHASPGSAGH
ncbi:MAG: DNA polymerase III subunit alpha, partial [Intrasporangium sp.]